ncbi:pantetheinase-like [Branchiostoma lanceolatum]|uniref:pantetheinase-like n=1 Tax=Branchiostoma lanceolatum TaxID=7740 RepID=UPI0034540CDC
MPMFAILVLLWMSRAVCSYDDTSFVAAVYEHAVVWTSDPTQPPTRQEAIDHMKHNLDVYRAQTREAKRQGADIIVFPEDGIHGFQSRDNQYAYLETIPDPEKIVWNPCDDPDRFNDTPVQQDLSCMAKENDIYVVANFGDKQFCDTSEDSSCPNDGRYQFNTDVVFANDGTIVARYHKEHLFMTELQFNRPPAVELVTFQTPFGKFGVFTCFDVLFHDPAVALVEDYGVDTIVFPTAWMDVLPLFVSVEFHQAWAMGMGVNFLSANTHVLDRRMTGSTISTPSGAVSYYHDMNSTDGKLLVAEISIKPIKNVVTSTDLPITEHDTAFVSDLFGDPFTFVELQKESDYVIVCQNDLCCSLNYTKSEISSEIYAFGAFDDLHTKEGQYYLQICALVKCANSSRDSCGQPISDAQTTFFHLNMAGNFKFPHVFPEVLTSGIGMDLAVGEWEYKDGTILSTSGISKPLLSAALFGRVYERDDGTSKHASGAKELHVHFFLLFVLVSALQGVLFEWL